MQTMQADIHPINSEPLNTLHDVKNDVKNAVFTVYIEPVGWMFEAPAGMSLLQVAELAGRPGLELASSCRNGTCRTCICQLRSGQIIYRIKWPGLSLDEKRDGLILPCVAYPLSDVVMELSS